MNDERIAGRVVAIGQGQERGATQLARESVRLLADLAADGTIPDGHFADLFPQVVRDLTHSRPGLSQPLHAAQEMLAAWLEAGGASGGRAARAAIGEAALRWEEARKRAVDALAGHAAGTISGVAITLGYSSTLLRALEECWGRYTLTGVIVAESRPLCEGHRTAAALAALGIPTVLITDAEIGVFVSAAAAAAVGADTLLPSGYLVNKVGTNLLALAARRSRIPFYALAETAKILPGSHRRTPFSLEERDPAELLPEPFPGVAVRNVGLDITPARYITGYLTERGLLDRRGIAALARAPRAATASPVRRSPGRPQP